VQIPNLRHVAVMLHRLGELQHRQLAFAAADDVDARTIDHVRRVRRVRTADDDGDVEVLLDLDRERLERVMHARQRREGDEPGVVGFDGPHQIRCVGNQQQVGLVSIRLQDAGEIGDANGLLNPVVLDEQNLHAAHTPGQTVTN
jgi:hypothetical protein